MLMKSLLNPTQGRGMIDRRANQVVRGLKLLVPPLISGERKWVLEVESITNGQ